MQVTVVSIKVKPERIEAFRAATLENVAASLKEPGVARFELFQDRDDPTHFVLFEAYRDAEGPARHKESSHYLKWKDLAEPMMAEPRTRTFLELLDAGR
ncbi:MAG TPA: putative quinol monooxygenase [Rectinemataceae bacterium]|nr:putative quinol monooxygenase [Rectinemataceae bacterium]